MELPGWLPVAAILAVGMSLNGPRPADAFNVDVSAPQLLHGEKESLFGFSVSLWLDSKNHRSLVVGAPRGTQAEAANKTFILGNIYFCRPSGNNNENDTCTVRTDLPELSFDDYSLPAVQWADDVFKTQGMGFGETLQSRKRKGSVLVACAPRFPMMLESEQRNLKLLQTRGACFVLDNKNKGNVKKALPYPYYGMKNHKKVKTLCTINNYECSGLAEMGFSAAITEDGRSTIFLGGPAGFFSEGVTVSMGASSDSWTRSRATKQVMVGDSSLDRDMEGFSTAVGKFNGKSEFVATSAPGHENKGKIKFYTKVLKKRKTELMGSEPGGMFGFALAVGDFDRDKKDDLVVAAPFSSYGELSQDKGMVFVYYAPTDDTSNRETLSLEGKEPWSRFGQAVNSPGDLDQDGYDDLIVGAPYANGGRGAVFIYNGGTEGLQRRPSQIIQASDLPFSLSWFGFSIDGGLDFDDNGYPDVLIGAPGSDNAVHFRTGPVVSLMGKIEFESTAISLEDPSCSIMLDGILQDVVCFNLTVFLQYEAKFTSDPFLLRLNIELDHTRRRLAFWDTHDHIYNRIHNITSITAEENPLYFRVYVKPQVRHLNLQENATAVLKTSLVQKPPERKQNSSELRVVISAFSQTSFTNQTTFECFNMTACITRSNLVLAANQPHALTIGTSDSEVIEVQLSVQENTAYSVTLNMTSPKELKFLRVLTNDYVPKCHPIENNEHKRMCRFPTNLPKGAQINLNFTFEYKALNLLKLESSELLFEFSISSDTLDLDTDDNYLNISLPLTSKVELEGYGWSSPETVEGKLGEVRSAYQLLQFHKQINATEMDPDELGPSVSHHFDLVNRGPSPLMRAKVILGLPQMLLRNLTAFYLVSPIKTSSPKLKCIQPVLNDMYNLREEDEGLTNSTQEFEELDDSFSPDNGTQADEGEITEDVAEEEEETEPKDREIINEMKGSDLHKSAGRPKRSLPNIGNYQEDPSTSDSNSKLIAGDLDVKDTSKENERVEELVVNCDLIECLEIVCEISELMAEESVAIEINARLTIGALKLFHKDILNIESSLALYTNEKNVSLNDKPIDTLNTEDAEFIDSTQLGTSDVEDLVASTNGDGTLVTNTLEDTISSTTVKDSSDSYMTEDFTAGEDGEFGFTSKFPHKVDNSSNFAEETDMTGNYSSSFTETTYGLNESLTFSDDYYSSSTDYSFGFNESSTDSKNTRFDSTEYSATKKDSSNFYQSSTTENPSFDSTEYSVTKYDSSNVYESSTTENTSFDSTEYSVTKHDSSNVYESSTTENTSFDSTEYSVTKYDSSNVYESSTTENTSFDSTEYSVTKHDSSNVYESSTTENTSFDSTEYSVTKNDSSNFYKNSTTENTSFDFTEYSVTENNSSNFYENSTTENTSFDSTHHPTTSERSPTGEYHTSSSTDIYISNSTDYSADAETIGPLGNKSEPLRQKRQYHIIARTSVSFPTRSKNKDFANIRDLMLVAGFWKLLMAVMFGLMIIIVVCAILYKIGFFKRERITTEQRDEMRRTIQKRNEDIKYG